MTGTVLVLLTLQLAGTFVKGMLGISTAGGTVDPKAVLISVTVVAVVILVNLKGRGFWRTIAILTGTAVGWILAVVLGLSSVPVTKSPAIFQLPTLFAWGTPTIDPGVIIVAVLTGLLVLSNEVASIAAMERTLNTKVPPKSYNRGVTFTGIADIMAGAGATIGVVPYSASAGLVSIIGVAAKMPSIVFTILMMIMGLFPPVGAFLSSVPEPVGYSVLLASFCQMLGFGLKDYAKLELNPRQFFVIGLPLLIGTGITSLPSSVFAGIPAVLQYILGNGFVAGMVLCLLLEHVLLPQRLFSRD